MLLHLFLFPVVYRKLAMPLVFVSSVLVSATGIFFSYSEYNLLYGKNILIKPFSDTVYLFTFPTLCSIKTHLTFGASYFRKR